MEIGWEIPPQDMKSELECSPASKRMPVQRQTSTEPALLNERDPSQGEGFHQEF
jgi:hypothetical protein